MYVLLSIIQGTLNYVCKNQHARMFDCFYSCSVLDVVSMFHISNSSLVILDFKMSTVHCVFLPFCSDQVFGGNFRRTKLTLLYDTRF